MAKKYTYSQRLRDRYIIKNQRTGRTTHLMNDGRIVWEQDLKAIAEATKRQKAMGGTPLSGSHATHVGNIPTNEYFRMKMEAGDDQELLEKKILRWLADPNHRDFLTVDKL